MNSAGHQIMMAHRPRPPKIINYICIKFFAYRQMRNFSNLSSYQGARLSQSLTQWSRLEFIDENNNYYLYPGTPSSLIYQNHLMFNGRKMRTKPVALSTLSMGNEPFQNIFDHSVNTKFCWHHMYGYSASTDVYDFSDETYSAPESTRPFAYNLRTTYISPDYWNQTFGAINRCIPFACAIDVSNNPLDISTFSRWQFYSANDTGSSAAGSGLRQWVEGEIMGSVDNKNWWRLDIFNNVNMPTTNYAIAYTGNIVPRYGDIWYGLDLSTRDWENGIAVDNI